MEGRQDPITVFPRYTTILGGGLPWFSAPIPCSDYSRVSLAVWHGAVLISPTIGGIFLESNDSDEWSQCAGGPWSLPIGTGEMQISATLTKAWFQFGIIIGAGPTAGVTFWAEGFLERRVR